jgi:hypothetical protein
MAHRYWRVRILASADPLYKVISGLEFRTSPGGAAQTGTYAISDNSFLGVGVAADLFDGSNSTYVQWTNVRNPWASIDFGLGGDRDIVEVLIAPRTSTVARQGTLFQVQWSDNGTNWVNAWYIYQPSWAINTPQVFTKPNLSLSCRYWAVIETQVDSAANTGMLVSEINMFEYPGGASVIGSGTSFGVSMDSSYPSSRAFDGNTGTTARSVGQFLHSMIGYDFGFGKTQRVRQLNWRSRTGIDTFTGSPLRGNVVRSNDFVNWQICSPDFSYANEDWLGGQTKTLYSEPFVSSTIILDYGFEQAIGNVFDVLPYYPIEEAWIWSTSIHEAENGTEKRLALLGTPRYRHKYNFPIRRDADRNKLYEAFRSYAGAKIVLPLFASMTRITVPTTIGDTVVFFDPAATDIRGGDVAVFYHPISGRMIAETISSINGDGADLYSPASASYDGSWYIMPALASHLQTEQSLAMGSQTGSASVEFSSMVKRELTLLPSPSLITTRFESTIVLEKRPIAVSDQEETLAKGVVVQDNQKSLPEVLANFSSSKASYGVQWLVKSFDELKYWKEFFSEVKGRQKSFFMPSFRDDLPIFGSPSLGDMSIYTKNMGVIEAHTNDSHARLRIRSRAGTIYRRIDTAVDQEDGTARVFLTSSIGSNPGRNNIFAVSYLRRVRLDSDVVAISHEKNYSVITASVRSIEA